MPLVDPTSISDDDLRPWIVDEEYDNKVLAAMSKFDETLSQTSYSRYAGCHSHSDLDKIRHDDIMQYGDMLATQEQECGGYEGVEGEEDGEVNYMTVHDGDNDEEGERANMLPIEESDEDEEGDEGGDECTPLGEDKEVLKLASSMNNIDEERFMKTHTMRLLLQKEKSKREEQFREGTIRAAAAYNSTKIPSSKYMPTHKTRVYKEWVDAQKDLRMSESMKEKAYLLDRPTTAFINTLIDQEREILAESFTKQEIERASSREESMKRSQQLATQAEKDQEVVDFNEQKKCLNRFNKLYPDLKMKIPSSPLTSARPMTSSGGNAARPFALTGDVDYHERPSTSCSRDVGVERGGKGKPRSPLRPFTADEKSKLNFKKSKPSFHDKRFDMTLVLGLTDIKNHKFPSANTDSIPSNNSAIVKYRTPREQMLDSITKTTTADEEDAKRKATLRVKQAAKAVKELSSQSTSAPHSAGRFSLSRPATPLSTLGINGAKGILDPAPAKSTALNKKYKKNTKNTLPPDNSVTSISSRRPIPQKEQSVFLKPAKAKVKTLRDLMKTTTGVDSRLFNKGFQSEIPYDAPAERKKTLMAAVDSKATDNIDSTGDTLVNPGFFEAMGPDRIYLSESSKFHAADERHMKQLMNREKSHITESDQIRKWALDSLSSGRKLFNGGGGGFHYS